ncbi:cytochrome c peroxidase [Catalinimonas alkaloidigena]|uniref:Cytochrome c peroxidase n=1 Tax=Catalinimonas alkaloidigena TaxID=1075417 RepID=A0A1G9DET3_9BACT|nr:cytochrome c peroxidase [Catalinimonas alkaloidigena]SDK62388.1 cytochrome c peroxidase [Catalinimonas alkaloidigena]
MRTFYALLTTVLLFALVVTAFTTQELPTTALRERYVRDLTAFQASLASLAKTSEAYDGTAGAYQRLQQAYFRSRTAYKRIEFLIDYLDREAVQRQINGAPLPKLLETAPSLTILEPKGLQVIDELMFEETLDKAALVGTVHTLQQHVQALAEYQRRRPLLDRHFFEGTRFELIRLLALGITGFDTPGSLHALPDTRAALQAMSDHAQLYTPALTRTAPDVATRLQTHYTEAIAYLDQHQDFATFDRLYFLRQYLNPLFKTTLEAQLALGIESTPETQPRTTRFATNYQADNMFSADFLQADYFMRNAAPTSAQVELGKLLFFDPALSQNGERSCASCHQPERAFTDGQDKSVAMDFNGTVLRNAPTLLNSVFADRYFYDLRVDVLEDQFEHVVTGKLEFHNDYFTIIETLGRSPEYLALFKEAFPEAGHHALSKPTIAAALSAYVASLQSFNSPFDQYVRGELDTLQPAVIRGFNLFMGKAACGTCHFAPTFAGLVPPFYEESESEVLGVPATIDTLHPVLDEDLGRYDGRLKERAPFYRHSFKTTTVRNAALTAPYMHNGVYETLEEVIDFYNKGGGTGLGLEVPDQTLAPDPLDLSTQEKQDLIAFIGALTDTTGLTERPARLPSFEDPALAKRTIGGTY